MVASPKENAMLKIYGHPASICTRKVTMTAAESNVPYELDLVDFTKGEHKAPAFVARQPFGRMPAIEDDGFELFESRAIARYINEKAGGRLAPTTLQDKARMEQWISVETSEYNGNAMKFIYQYIFQRTQEAAVLEAAASGLRTTLGAMEKQLAKTPFLVGSEFTLADICFMPCTEYLMATPAKDIFAAFPSVLAWWARVSARPTWKKATGAN